VEAPPAEAPQSAPPHARADLIDEGEEEVDGAEHREEEAAAAKEAAKERLAALEAAKAAAVAGEDYARAADLKQQIREHIATEEALEATEAEALPEEPNKKYDRFSTRLEAYSAPPAAVAPSPENPDRSPVVAGAFSLPPRPIAAPPASVPSARDAPFSLLKAAPAHAPPAPANPAIAGSGAAAPPPPPRVGMTPRALAAVDARSFAECDAYFEEQAKLAVGHGSPGASAVSAAMGSAMDSMRRLGGLPGRSLTRTSSGGGSSGFEANKAAAADAAAMDRLSFRLAAAQREFGAIPDGDRPASARAAHLAREMAECVAEMNKFKGAAADGSYGGDGGGAFALNPLMLKGQSKRGQPSPLPIPANGVGPFFPDDDPSGGDGNGGGKFEKGERAFDPACGLLAAALAAAAGLGKAALHVTQEDFAQKVSGEGCYLLQLLMAARCGIHA